MLSALVMQIAYGGEQHALQPEIKICQFRERYSYKFAGGGPCHYGVVAAVVLLLKKIGWESLPCLDSQAGEELRVQNFWRQLPPLYHF